MLKLIQGILRIFCITLLYVITSASGYAQNSLGYGLPLDLASLNSHFAALQKQIIVSYKLPVLTTSISLETFVYNIVSDTTKSKQRDTDGDGIIDSIDKCPDEKGVALYDGCPVPDTDNDSIPDDLDNCPTVAGLAKYKGCPAPDKDGDKINDEEDKCPDQPGVARYEGCPVKDTDSDGIEDNLDECVTIPGTESNFGCPEEKGSKAPKRVQKGRKN